MPKSKKKPTKQFLPKTTKSKIIFFVVAFAILGSIVIFARAATTVSDELLSSSNLAVGYTEAGVVSIERDSHGNVTSMTRPRAIDISKDGRLYCTPRDSGTITERQLNDQELESIENQIVAAQPLGAEIDDTNGVVIGDEPRVYVDGFEPYIAGNMYSLSKSEAFVSKTVDYLEQLCSVPGNPIPSEDAPEVILSGQASGLVNTVAKALMPTAYAGGSPSGATGYYGVNKPHEDVQNILMTSNRHRHGLQATGATPCLRDAAREWSRVMVSLGFIRHTSQLNVLPEKYCKGGGWTKIGENVGVSGLLIPNNDEASAAASTEVFRAFMASPGHRKNILDPQFTHHGVGSYTTPDGRRVYVTQIFWAGRNLPK